MDYIYCRAIAVLWCSGSGSTFVLVRKLIAYGLIIAIVGGLAAWAWLHRRRILAERRRNHGPRQD